MTREEAIERMKIIKGDCYIIDNPKDKEAFDMSIFALEQEPCELLIIKSDILLHQDDRKKWMDSIKREKENGVIILPPYFTPLLVPNDVEIRSEQPCDDAISRILKKMWNCRGKHTTSIDKVAMEQIIRDELSVTQKPIECDDAISRQAVLDGLKGCMCEDWVKTLFATMVEQLPSVTQKSGKWIDINGIYAECSNCNEEIYITGDFNYCPNCGAKMVEPQESEEQ